MIYKWNTARLVLVYNLPTNQLWRHETILFIKQTEPITYYRIV